MSEAETTMKTRQQIDQEYTQAAATLGHLHTQIKATESQIQAILAQPVVKTETTKTAAE